MKKFIITLLFIMLLSCMPVFAGDYIVTINNSDDITKYNLHPIFEEIGLYTTDEETAKQLYSKGIATRITEDKPLYLPDIDYTDSMEQDNGLTAMSSAYNDVYYNEEIYYEQLAINDYIETYKPSGNVRIAVIDTGINKEHIDFAGARIEQGYNFVTNSTDTTDLYKHGTMVTSLIAAPRNDGVGVAGIAPNATIVPLVAMTRVDGRVEGSAAHLLLAVKAAVDTYDCKIITTSLGVTSKLSELDAAVKYATSKGVIVIAAAGNSGANSDAEIASKLSYPASSPGAISIGSTDANYNRAAYSQKNERVDAVAFGGNLTMPSNTSTTAYSRASGTSFSTPVIAGITALFVSNHPDITPQQYKRILKGSAMDIGVSGGSDFMGSGMPNCMAMEQMYNDRNHVYISPIYDGESRNIKLAGDGTVNEAVLVAVSENDGVFNDYTLYNISFDTDDLAYITDDIPSDRLKYFVITNINTLQSLSAVLEH